MKRLSFIALPAGDRPSWHDSLRFRVLLVTTLLFGLMAATVIYNSIRVVMAATLESVRDSVQQTSEMLNLAIVPYAVNGEFATIQAFLDALLDEQQARQTGLVYLVVGKEDGNLIVQSGLQGNHLPAPNAPDSYHDAVLREGMVNIRQPLLLENNAVGFVQYGLTFSLMLQASQRLNQEGIILMAIGMALFMISILGIMLKLIRRLDMLGKASLAIATGDYYRRVKVNGRDEISLLAANFNRMAEAIGQRIEEITALNQDLENRVMQRTQDLSDLNFTLQQTIDDLKWTQENLIRSEKLAGLGALVAGVAHELNTPIGNAVTVASTLQDHTRQLLADLHSGLKRSTLDAYLHDTQSAAALLVRNLQRAAELVISFKHVAVDQTSEKARSFDLRTTIQEIIATLMPTIKKTGHQLTVEVPAQISLNSYPGALGQILTNLVNNAVLHAFPAETKGNMRLTAERLPNHLLRLSFHDDGLGMSEETCKRIFDPFFTTRLGQGGSGLGMSIVHNLVTGVLKGFIDVESQPNQGTSIRITIPTNDLPQPETW